MTDKAESPPDRGSLLLIRIIVFLSLRIGRPLGRALLYPISLYFLVFAPSARRASSEYLTIVLQRRPGWLDLFRHLHVHASVLLDRFFVLARGSQGFDLEFHGLDVIEDQKHRQQGCILLGAHLGSFDVLRCLAAEHKVAVKAMMDVDVSRKFNRILGSIDPTFSDSVIALGTPTSLIAASQFVRRGGFVALLGDRAIRDDKLVEISFFGRPAKLPIGPLMLAMTLKVPVILFVGLRQRDRGYSIHFERCPETPAGPARALPETEMRNWLQAYADRLEHYCRLSPYNWFNFYDFWAH
jgi:predicted LPLAT superfamily acyltransferase